MAIPPNAGWSHSLGAMYYYRHGWNYIGLVPSRNLERFKTGAVAPLSDHSQKSDTSQNAMLNAQNKLRPLLKMPKSGSCWRKNIKYFQGDGYKGSVNLSPAWFQQGHDMSVLMHKPYFSAAQSESGNIATTPEGLRELRKACCIGLASCYLRVQCDCEHNSKLYFSGNLLVRAPGNLPRSEEHTSELQSP